MRIDPAYESRAMDCMKRIAETNIEWAIPSTFSVAINVSLSQDDSALGKYLCKVAAKLNIDMRGVESQDAFEKTLGATAKKYMGSTVPRVQETLGSAGEIFLPFEDRPYNVVSSASHFFHGGGLFFGRTYPDSPARMQYKARVLRYAPVLGVGLFGEESIDQAAARAYTTELQTKQELFKSFGAVAEDRKFFNVSRSGNARIPIDFPFNPKPVMKEESGYVMGRLYADVDAFPDNVKEKMREVTPKSIDDSTVLWVGRGISYNILGQREEGYFNSISFLELGNGERKRGILILDVETPRTDYREEFPHKKPAQ